MKKEKALTLIELLVVFSFFGLLTTITLVGVKEGIERARDAKRIMALNQITKALEMYYSEYGHYPRHPIDWPGGQYEIIMTSAYAPFLPNWIGWDESDGNFMEEFFNPVPIDPINDYKEGPIVFLIEKVYAVILAYYPWEGAYVYAYCTDQEGQTYDLIALLENNHSESCENRCWKMHVASKQEGEDVYWCGGCGGSKTVYDYDSYALPEYMNHIYSGR